MKPLPFFCGLNPMSKSSGVEFIWTTIEGINQDIMMPRIDGVNETDVRLLLDITVFEHICLKFRKNMNYIDELRATFEILVGDHYEFKTLNLDANRVGAKGLLDYLIFPLIVRKIIWNHPNSSCLHLFTIPLEILRFGLGIAITIILAPIVALVHLIRFLHDLVSKCFEYNARLAEDIHNLDPEPITLKK